MGQPDRNSIFNGFHNWTKTRCLTFFFQAIIYLTEDLQYCWRFSIFQEMHTWPPLDWFSMFPSLSNFHVMKKQNKNNYFVTYWYRLTSQSISKLFIDKLSSIKHLIITDIQGIIVELRESISNFRQRRLSLHMSFLFSWLVMW